MPCSFQKGAFWKISGSKTYFFSQKGTCLCITDSLSHTTYVETNKLPMPETNSGNMSVGLNNRYTKIAFGGAITGSRVTRKKNEKGKSGENGYANSKRKRLKIIQVIYHHYMKKDFFYK